MKYDSYEDWYDNGPGSENFKRSMSKPSTSLLDKGLRYDDLQAKHDELAELVAKVIDQHRIEVVIVCDENCWCWELEAALRKAVEEK
jgi:hypothetical protein